MTVRDVSCREEVALALPWLAGRADSCRLPDPALLPLLLVSSSAGREGSTARDFLPRLTLTSAGWRGGGVS